MSKEKARLTSINEEKKVENCVPLSKVNVQKILRMFVSPNQKCTVSVQVLVTKFRIFATATPAYITGQMRKKYPGGVTHKWNLSEVCLFFYPLQKISMDKSPRNNMHVKMRNSQEYFPLTPTW